MEAVNNVNQGRLSVNILGFNKAPWNQFGRIPKQILIRDSKLSVVDLVWTSDLVYSKNLSPGQYVVSIAMLSKEADPQVVEINAGLTTHVGFDLPLPESYTSQFVLRKLSGQQQQNIFDRDDFKKYYNYKFELWSENKTYFLRNSLTRTEVRPFNEVIAVENDTETRKYLQISNPSFPSQIVCLPTHEDIFISFDVLEEKRVRRLLPGVIIKSDFPERARHLPLNVIIESNHFEAETLLELLTDGAIDSAKKIFNASMAEDLLYSKRRDPSAAAIGAYFLLKTNDLDRLHDWTRNLDNWFPGLADGAVIHAWHLIQLGRNKEISSSLIRERLLIAAERGVPIYTEGLRLLFEGLKMLSYQYEKNDRPVEKALARIQKYVEFADMNQRYTTFKGTSPKKPGINNEFIEKIDTFDKNGIRKRKK